MSRYTVLSSKSSSKANFIVREAYRLNRLRYWLLRFRFRLLALFLGLVLVTPLLGVFVFLVLIVGSWGEVQFLKLVVVTPDLRSNGVVIALLVGAVLQAFRIVGGIVVPALFGVPGPSWWTVYKTWLLLRDISSLKPSFRLLGILRGLVAWLLLIPIVGSSLLVLAMVCRAACPDSLFETIKSILGY